MIWPLPIPPLWVYDDTVDPADQKFCYGAIAQEESHPGITLGLELH
jgi:hypothetical protein